MLRFYHLLYFHMQNIFGWQLQTGPHHLLSKAHTRQESQLTSRKRQFVKTTRAVHVNVVADATKYRRDASDIQIDCHVVQKTTSMGRLRFAVYRQAFARLVYENNQTSIALEDGRCAVLPLRCMRWPENTGRSRAILREGSVHSSLHVDFLSQTPAWEVDEHVCRGNHLSRLEKLI